MEQNLEKKTAEIIEFSLWLKDVSIKRQNVLSKISNLHSNRTHKFAQQSKCIHSVVFVIIKMEWIIVSPSNMLWYGKTQHWLYYIAENRISNLLTTSEQKWH